jgi:hypothetical protein
MLADVHAYLRERTLIGTELYVLSPEYRPVAIAVSVSVRDPRTETETLQAVERAVLEYLWPLAPGGPEGRGWPLGRAVDADEVRTQVARVAGVLSASEVVLFVPVGKTWRELSRGAPLELQDFQLPEVVGVSAQRGAGHPALPPAFRPPSSDAEALVPAPVVPPVC